MNAKFKAREWRPLTALGVLLLICARGAAQTPVPPAVTRVTLDQAIDMAIQHNHSLQAARTMILQNQAQEITANLRPNPTLNGDAQFLPLFQPSNFTSSYLNNSAHSDVGVGYLFETRQPAAKPARRRPRIRRR